MSGTWPGAADDDPGAGLVLDPAGVGLAGGGLVRWWCDGRVATGLALDPLSAESSR